jgi:hypothetical protein
VKPSVNTVTTLPLSTTQHPQLSTGTEPSVGAADMQTPPDCVQGLQQSVGEPAGIYDVEPPSGTSTDASNVPMYEANNTSFSTVGSTADQPVATSTSHVVTNLLSLRRPHLDRSLTLHPGKRRLLVYCVQVPQIHQGI